MNSAVIVSSGSGKRFGGNIPKQFIKFQGEEILSFSVRTFLEHPQIDEVIIVCHSNWIDQIRHNYPNCTTVKGGKQRQDSCLNGIITLEQSRKRNLLRKRGYIFVNSFKINIPCFGGLMDTVFFFNNNIFLEFIISYLDL